MDSIEERDNVLHELRQGLHTARPDKLSPVRFDKAHELFEGSSNQQTLIHEWLQKVILGRYRDADPLRILSVGCGSGILDFPLIKTIARSSRRIEYTGVDPNTVACERFRQAFEEARIPNVQLTLMEEGIESLAFRHRFHMIHAVHSLYYFDDPARILEQLITLLTPTGSVAIVQAPHAELNQLAHCFWSHHQAQKIWFSDCLGHHLRERRHDFSTQRIHGEVDITCCFRDSGPRGEMMLDFITQSDCVKLDREVREGCLRYLQSISRQHEERVLVPHPADAFLITRSEEPS